MRREQAGGPNGQGTGDWGGRELRALPRSLSKSSQLVAPHVENVEFSAPTTTGAEAVQQTLHLTEQVLQQQQHETLTS